jgi:hypothetical protein
MWKWLRNKVAVDPDTKCWHWLLYKNAGGYGRATVKVDGKWTNKFAHRITWELKHGPVPKGWTVDHLCRTRGCVNPKHLEAVPHKINVRRSTVAKLKQEQVNSIRTAYATGDISISMLARQYAMSEGAIGNVVRGNTWQ